MIDFLTLDIPRKIFRDMLKVLTALGIDGALGDLTK